MKDVDTEKPKVAYEFDLDNNPDRYLTLKTHRRMTSIKSEVPNLTHIQKAKAKELLERAMIDCQYYISNSEY